ncbi:unnamed protein product [Euphydryas editha]|uniref:PiggyBac transposable element-derived protein domain-containing protein n=1 Tax=Euphydryas editha TaxID=104508 RepID=A0AAU9URE3_EUPED|nr:unnamed protein product [Euphydryas editha]
MANIKEREIEEMLRMLENGELSEDNMEYDGEDLDFYPNPRDLQSVLEENSYSDEEGGVNDVIFDDPIGDGCQNLVDTEAFPDPPLIDESAESSAPSSTNIGRNLIWKRQALAFREEQINFKGNEALSEDIIAMQSPFQFFNYFFSNDLIAKIVEETNKYAVQKNPERPDIVNAKDIRQYLGILSFMSVYHYPSIRSYWGRYGFTPIKYTMPVNKFEKIRRVIHFNDNDKHLPITHQEHDKLQKLGPLIDHLNTKFSNVAIDQRLSIDEQMCSTKIGHFLKQYMPNKPHKWGFKLFMLCSLSGYVYKFIIYAGKERDDRLPNEPDIGVTGQIVIKLLRVVPRHQNYIVYFDNYYTSLPLLHYLAKEGIHSLGTIQRNRLGKSCKLPTKQEVMKNSVPRGAFHENVTSVDDVEITAVSWKDNKQVILASTHVGAEPVSQIERFDKKGKKKILIACPKLVKEYNAHMGGVELMDSYLGRYRIRMKSRKWYLRIFYHLVDLTIINAWILYKKVLSKKGKHTKEIMNLADFRSELADTLCKYETPRNNRGRPSNSSLDKEQPKKMRKNKPVQVLPPRDIRLDGVGHELVRNETRMRCMRPQCSLLSINKCNKCNVSLCSKKSTNCFAIFHS